MRADMHKKVVEGYRYFDEDVEGHRRGGLRGRCINPDVLRLRRERIVADIRDDGEGGREVFVSGMIETPKTVGVRFKGYGKKQDDNLPPLRRYLHKQVGRKWDDVYSELSRGLDRRSVLGQHVFDHMTHMVQRSVCLVDGQLHANTYWGVRPLYRGELWVDREGVLQRH